GQNMYAYKPDRGLWNLLIWDIDFAFFAQGPTTDLFGIGGANVGPKSSHPPFARIYWQALLQAANGPLRAEDANKVLDARYNAFRADGISPTSPDSIKSYIATRRSYILGLAASNSYSFTITSNNGTDFSTNRNLVVLTGTAPFEVRTITVNGTPGEVIWTTVSNWAIRVQLKPGENQLNIQGIDYEGKLVSNASALIKIQFNGVDESPLGNVVINEIMYNPPVQGASYIEIYNASTNNAFDLSGWRLEGVDFQFAPGTIIEPNSYLVVVKDAVQFAAAYGTTTPIAGEFSGTLKNEGETIKLVKPGRTPTDDVVISAVTYSSEAPWSESANGYGSSLQLIDAKQDTSRIINWTSAFIDTNFIPQTLISITDMWKYNQTADLTGSEWQNINYDDSSWQSGAALLYVETASLPAPKNTPLTLGRITYYFRKKFVFNGNPNGVSLRIYAIIDDGAVIYLNGNPVYSIRMPATSLTYSTLASGTVGDATLEGPFDIPATYLVNGTNVIAVEVHQNSTGSSDIVFGMSLETLKGNIALATPGSKNSVAMTLPTMPPVWLNEVQPYNFNTIADRVSEFDPWVEIYNSSTNTVPLNNFFLSDTLTNLVKWQFPSNYAIPAKARIVVFLDGQQGQSTQNELHANFRINSDVGIVLMSAIYAGSTNLIDYLSWKMAGPNRSYGSYPEGTAADRRLFYIPTPGEQNNPSAPSITVFINEWMADNTGTIADPADGDYEDWFEIYNPTDVPVSLEGYYLTDNLNQITQYRVPAGYTVPSKGYLLVWADGEANQNSSSRADLHVNFRLSADGEAIGLYAPDGSLVDAVTFEKQSADVTQGRFPDGSVQMNAFTNPTPGTANIIVEPNLAPIIRTIGNKVVMEGQTLVFQVEVTDPNREKQNLYFSLEDGAPQGAYIDPVSGIFTWTPSEVQGGASYPIIVRVTDSGTPPLSATQSFTVSVEKTNSPPVIVIPPNQVVNEGEIVSFTVNAVDVDLPPQTFTFSLGNDAPAGAAINPTNGLFTWITSEVHGPGIYSFFIYTSDSGEPQMSDARRITITVNEVNQPPVFSANLNQTTHIGCAFKFIVPTTDPDLPKNKLFFDLVDGAATGASLERNSGVFQWNPGNEFKFTTNKFTIVVSDDGEPSLSATNSFSIVLLDELKVQYLLTETNYVGFKWNTIPLRQYCLEYKDKFSQHSWIPAVENTFATNSFMEIYLPISSNSSRFYRVISTP
ncbi:MAG: lamin tail domain-containing protein, partial [Verrucomicrobiae bacterium]|nr:lamin tail domain-containing protein [Verrucomicrobiae bacterium]